MKTFVRGALLSSAVALIGCGGSSSSAPCAAVDAAHPATHLSSYCLVDLKDGVVIPTSSAAPHTTPYNVNTPLFSDYAIKSRMLYLPTGGSATYDETEELGMPDGTILIKTFSFAPDVRQPTVGVAPVETRLLVKDASGWHPLDYIWDADLKDATYSPGGETKAETFIDTSGATRTAAYLVPNQAQCTECHDASGQTGLLGVKIRQLNGDYPYPEGTENQITHLIDAGLLTGAPTPEPSALPRLPVWDDPSTGTVGARASAYLEANCAHCHNASGLARTTGLFLWSSITDPATRGICKTPIAAGEGTGGNLFDIVPGQPSMSIVPYRMESTEPGIEMPQIGRSVVHTEGVQLISDYITALTGNCQ